MGRLSPRDAERWHRLAGRVAEDLEPRLDRRVMANRAAEVRRDGWRPSAVRPALAAARRQARRLATSARYVVRTDVAAFYASVTPAVLHRALADVDPDGARVAAEMLEGWGSEGYEGLPIGPPGSAVLANAVLVPVDRALANHRYLRWVDDYLVAAPSEPAAIELLERIDESLDGLRLRRATAKTHVVESGGNLTWLGQASATDAGR